MKKFILVLLTTLMIFSLAACGKKGNDTADDVTTVKVGVCGANNNMWYAVQKVLDDQDAKIVIELVEFDAYTLPNEALNSGEIDLNAFQHKAFLNNECTKQGYDLTVIGDTIIAPLSLYSKAFDSLDALKAAAAASETPLKIGVPDDGTNLSRAIKLLETAGLLTVDPAAGFTPEIANITGYLYNITVEPVTANTLPATLDDFAASTINGTYAIPAGLVPSKDALIIESQSEGAENPFVNIIVSRTADKDNAVYKTIVAAYNTDLVAKYILEEYKEAFFPAFNYDSNYTLTDSVDSLTAYRSKYAK